MNEYRSRYESLIDEQIRLAEERGEFDNLPGAGKPLTNLGAPDDELWWLKGYLRREGLSGEALLPPSLQLRKEIERLPETVRGLPSEQAVRETVRELNHRIVAFLTAPSGPAARVGPVRADGVVAQWRADRRAAARSAVASVRHRDDACGDPVPARIPWWRRIGRAQPR